MQNIVVLITDNEKVAQKVNKKVLLLRNTDILQTIHHADCFDKVRKIKPVLIFYHLKLNREDDFLNFLQKARQNKDLKTCSIILIYDDLDENLLCSAFEKGVTDFIRTTASDTEYTIRTLWCLQQRDNVEDNKNKKDLLSQLKILDRKNQVFTENYTYTVLKEESKKDWGCFAVVAPDINSRNKISPDTLMSIIKDNVRTCDILGYASDFKIYLWFRNTSNEDTRKILTKIKKALTSDFTISAGYTETKEIPFDEAEVLANKALSKALLKGNSFICVQEKPKQQKPKTTKIDIQNFKQHKANSAKKLETILSPLFFQMQKTNEDKLFETKITQNVSEEKSYFSLKNQDCESSFIVTYPGFTTINIEILQKINDKEKRKKYYIDTNELSEEKIEEMLEDFINDFQNLTTAL